LTVNVAGAKLKVAPVVFATWVTEIVAEPTWCGVTVTVGPKGSVTQLVKVIEFGLTVATAVLLDATETCSVVDLVTLQPFLPSPFRGTT
jgi:hypothetical protein